LAALQEWWRQEADRKKLSQLEELRRRYEQGDLSALEEATGQAISPPVVRATSERANLPRPEPPHRYAKKDRADYNRWLRDNEDYHAKNPIHFKGDEQKLSFGLQYVSETLRTLWETYVVQRRLAEPHWSPSWEDLKEKMLGALGTPEERKQAAYDTIKACRQRPTQSPTDLLNYLQPLWVEIGESSPYRMLAEFTAALREDVRRELRHLPQQSKATLSQVEQEANRIHRDLVQAGKVKSGPSKDKRRPPSPPEPGPANQAPKKPKKGSNGRPWSKTPRPGKEKPKGDVKCFACKQPGHLLPQCPDTEKKEAYYAKKAKEKGQKD